MVILLSLVFVVTFTKIGCILGASEYEDPIPYALSPAYLQFLSKQERSIYQTLKEYEHVLEERLKLLKKLVFCLCNFTNVSAIYVFQIHQRL